MENLLKEANFPEVQISFERGEIVTRNQAQLLNPLTEQQVASPYIHPGSSISCEDGTQGFGTVGVDWRL
jgi:hypothetical protein